MIDTSYPSTLSMILFFNFFLVYVVFSEQSLAGAVSKYAETACTLSSSER